MSCTNGARETSRGDGLFWLRWGGYDMGTHATRRTIERRRMRIVVGTIVLLSTLVIPPHAAAQKPTPPEPSIVLPGGEFQPADQPQGGPPEPPPSFEKILDGPVSGTDAIDQLGIELPTAAAVSGLPAPTNSWQR